MINKPSEASGFISCVTKVLLAVLPPLILCSCLASSSWMKDSDTPSLTAGIPEKQKTKLSRASSAEEPWPPYMATYHFSLGILQNFDGNSDEAIREFEAALSYDPKSARIATELASAYAEKDEIQKALAICEKALPNNPDDVELNMILGGLYMSNRDQKRAMAQYLKVISLDPQHVNARLYLGMIYSEAKQHKEAAEAFGSLLAISPEHFMAHYYSGKNFVDMGNYEEAEKAFKKTLAIRPNFDTALIDLALLYEKQKKSGLAIETLKDYLSLHPSNLNARVKLSELYLRDKRYDDAERELKKILKQNKNNPEVQLTMGLLYLDSGRHDQAIEIFGDLAKKFPTDHRFIYLSSSAYEEKKDYKQAVSQLQTIPVASDLYSNAQVRIAMMYKKQGQLKEALSVLDKAIKNKKEANLYAVLSSLQEENKDTQAAEKALTDGIQAFPQGVELYYSLGVLYEKAGRFDDSIKQMNAVLKIDPNYADALNFIGYSYVERGIKLDEAEKLIKKALLLKPGSGYIIDSLGWLYFRQNKLAEALKCLKDASAALPGDSTIAEHLGDVFLKNNQIKEALDAYKKALKLAPENKNIQKKIDDLQKKP